MHKETSNYLSAIVFNTFVCVFIKVSMGKKNGTDFYQ